MRPCTGCESVRKSDLADDHNAVFEYWQMLVALRVMALLSTLWNCAAGHPGAVQQPGMHEAEHNVVIGLGSDVHWWEVHRTWEPT